jgi:birA, biotin-[acetyl-CoA-carboxylase] ligase region
MKTKILRMLRETEQFISGQDLCEKLGVSRTAVWKVIKQLREEGYQIEAIQNKGYYIASSPEIFSASEISSRLSVDSFIQKIYEYPEIDSTNKQAKKLAEEGAVNGTLVIADKQYQGKGRHGRSWETQSGTSIAMSLILKPDIMPNFASMLTLVMGMSILEVCQKVLSVKVEIKWPNDVIIDGKKVCGILTEMSAEADYVNYLIIGVGINVNGTTFIDDLEDRAISLKMATGEQISRSELTVEILETFQKNYKLFLENKNVRFLMKQYNANLAGINNKVRVFNQQEEYIGTSLGINESGELLVENAAGKCQKVYSGEVSVRGIYGYV